MIYCETKEFKPESVRRPQATRPPPSALNADTLAVTLGSVRTVPGARNPFVAAQKGKMEDSAMKGNVGQLKVLPRDQEDGEPILVPATLGMRRRISALAEYGIYGRSVEEVAQRLICRALVEMERE